MCLRCCLKYIFCVLFWSLGYLKKLSNSCGLQIGHSWSLLLWSISDILLTFPFSSLENFSYVCFELFFSNAQSYNNLRLGKLFFFCFSPKFLVVDID